MSELDLPLLPNAEQIRRRMFATVRRGFDPDQVREYLTQVADQVENLEAQIREAKLASEAATSAPGRGTDPYEEVAGRVADLLRTADQQAQTLIADAKAQAEQILGRSRAEADGVRLDAQSRAEAVRAEAESALATAREEAERLLSGLTDRRRSVVGELRDLQALLQGMAKQLETAVARAPVEAETPSRAEGAREAPSPAEGGGAPTEVPGAPSKTPGEEDVVDPRYEDLWASSDSVDLTLPDLPPLDDIDKVVETEERERSGGDTR